MPLTTSRAVSADRDDFYRNVGRLPLAPGKSRLSAAACPDLIQHYRTLWWNGDLRRPPPETVPLDAMLQLVLNCQQRLEFEANVRVQERLSAEELVDVPAPGVPFNYLGIPDDDNSTGVATDDIVDEYDWLRKLVIDQSS